MVDVWVRGATAYMVTERAASIVAGPIPSLSPRPDPPTLHRFEPRIRRSLPTLPQRAVRYHQVAHLGAWRPPSCDPGLTQITIVGESRPLDLEEEHGGMVFVQTREADPPDQVSGGDWPAPPQILPLPISTSPPGSFLGSFDQGCAQLPLHPHSRVHLIAGTSPAGLVVTIETAATQCHSSGFVLVHLRAYPMAPDGRWMNEGDAPVGLQIPTNIPWEPKLGRIKITSTPCAVSGIFLATCKGIERATGLYTTRLWLLRFK
jgi:hypothetical protein